MAAQSHRRAGICSPPMLPSAPITSRTWSGTSAPAARPLARSALPIGTAPASTKAMSPPMAGTAGAATTPTQASWWMARLSTWYGASRSAQDDWAITYANRPAGRLAEFHIDRGHQRRMRSTLRDRYRHQWDAVCHLFQSAPTGKRRPRKVVLYSKPGALGMGRSHSRRSRGIAAARWSAAMASTCALPARGRNDDGEIIYNRVQFAPPIHRLAPRRDSTAACASDQE